MLARSPGKEHGDEEQMAYLNGCEGPRTLLVPSDPTTAFISSSHVRTLITVGALDAVAELVPPAVSGPKITPPEVCSPFEGRSENGAAEL